MNSASATGRCRALLHHFSFLICKHGSSDVSRMSAGLGEITHKAFSWGSAVDASCCDHKRETFLCLCCCHTDLEGMDRRGLLPLYWCYSGVPPKSHFHYLLVCLARLLLTHRFHMALGHPRVATAVGAEWQKPSKPVSPVWKRSHWGPQFLNLTVTIFFLSTFQLLLQYLILCLILLSGRGFMRIKLK